MHAQTSVQFVPGSILCTGRAHLALVLCITFSSLIPVSLSETIVSPRLHKAHEYSRFLDFPSVLRRQRQISYL